MGRLVDIDEVIKVAENTFPQEDVRKIMWVLCHTPTAYDISKVVAELEDKIKDVEKIIVTPPQDKLDEIANDTAEDFIGAWESAIKVVRKGGVE